MWRFVATKPISSHMKGLSREFRYINEPKNIIRARAKICVGIMLFAIFGRDSLIDREFLFFIIVTQNIWIKEPEYVVWS